MVLAAASAAFAFAGTAAAQPTLDDLYKAAVAAGEKQVWVYGPPSTEIRAQFNKTFAKRFPQIDVAYSGMTGTQIMSKMSAETKAGVTSADIMISGTSSITRNLKPAGLLQPVDPLVVVAEARDPSKWLGGGLAYGDDEKMMLVMLSTVTMTAVVNNDLVKPGEISSDADLLDPRWKGKIVANSPLRGGSALVTFRRFYDLHGPEFITRLVKDQEVVFSADIRQTVDWIAKGRYAVLIGGDPTIVGGFVEKGVTTLGTDLNIGWKDTQTATAGFGGLAVAAKQHHPNAAKLFLNWLLTQEGQLAVGNGLEFGSRRIDVDIEKVLPALKTRADREYVATYTEEFSLHPNTDNMQKLIRELGVTAK